MRTVSRSAPSAGTSGTMGGAPQPTGSRPGRRQVSMDDGMYMWILVLLEVGVVAFLRNTFSRYHGG